MNQITDDDLRKIAAEVEREYGMGGLTGGIYEDFALDVAKRAIGVERERCANDAAALNWIERQHLEELGMGLVIDAPNDGQYYVCGDSGTTHYGKTLREALGKALAEGA